MNTRAHQSQTPKNSGQRTELIDPHNLSAEHGLLRPESLVGTYEHKLRSRSEAQALQARVAKRLTADLRAEALRHVLVVLEPLYVTAAECLFDYAPPLALTLLPNPGDWSGASAVLTRWGWL